MEDRRLACPFSFILTGRIFLCPLTQGAVRVPAKIRPSPLPFFLRVKKHALKAQQDHRGKRAKASRRPE